ncbi:MAG: STAS domain-containing protein [Eggerthellaceae bacterium]|nr:STAS domain-containing protein [Eggerthellaceae bacterium]
MLEISNTVNGDVSEVKLVGRLDVKAAKSADQAFAQAVEASKNVVLDMSELDYIASAGLRALKRPRSDVDAKGGTLVLRDVQSNVMELFEMTGFAVMFTFE